MNTPGVYVKEISKLPPSVAPVNTAIPAFIGYTEKDTLPSGDLLINTPMRILSINEYTLMFGGPPFQSIEVQVGPNKREIAGNTEEIQVDVLKASINSYSPYRMYHALNLYFTNGGGPCYVISSGKYKESDTDLLEDTELQAALDAVSMVNEVTLLLFTDVEDLDETRYYGLYAAALDQCNTLKDRFTIIDIKRSINDTTKTPVETMRENLSSDYLKYGACYYPWINANLNYAYDDTSITLKQPVGTIDENGDAIANDPQELNDQNLQQIIAGNLANINDLFRSELDNAINGLPVHLPPASAMAGIYGRVDNDRGVWKAPANVTVNGIVSLTDVISDLEQEDLNIHPTGMSVNALRSFPGLGALVWGARTLKGNSNEWRYISTRRFFNFAEESIKMAIQPFVFEPNDANTWGRIKGMIESFLTQQWRAGALAGAIPEQAFFVAIGLGQTMTSEDILNGILRVEVGLAVARPGEFIMLEFTHMLQQS